MLFTRAFHKICYAIGVTSVSAWLHRNRVTILCYHGVSRHIDSIRDDPWKLTLHASTLESQFQYLSNHYHVISLRSFLEAQRSRVKLKPKSVVITFDDGMRNFMTVAAPCLAKYNYPATVMVITDYVEEMSHKKATKLSSDEWTPDDDERYLSWGEIQSLRSTLDVDFGSHTCSHPRLNLLALDDARLELQKSRDAIVQNTGQSSVTFSYPHGQFSPAVAKLVKETGYDCGLTAVDGSNGQSTDSFLLHRTVILSDDDQAVFAMRLSGLTSYWPAFKTGLRPVIKQLISRGRGYRYKQKISLSDSSESPNEIT